MNISYMNITKLNFARHIFKNLEKKFVTKSDKSVEQRLNLRRS